MTRVALVTGASRPDGLGRAIALELARRGCDVAVSYRDEVTGAAAVVAELTALGRRAQAFQAELLEPAACHALVAAVTETLGTPEILVNNAGGHFVAPFLELTRAQWDRDLALNLSSAFHCSQAAARAMVEHGRGGRIVMIGSSAAAIVGPNIGQYGAAKAGLETLARYLAFELAPHGITVNTVAPGPTGPTSVNRDLIGSPEGLRNTERNIPLGRLGAPADIAAAVAYLASPEAAFVTGTRIAVDGGYTLGKDQLA